MNEGWRCPKCGRGNSPALSTCPCGPDQLTQTSGTANVTLGKDARCSYCGGALWVCRGSHSIS